MRPRYQGPTLAQRLNNALSELHSLKLQHQKEKQIMAEQIQQLKEENSLLRAKVKQLKRQGKETGHQQQHVDSTHETEHVVSKIKSYLLRLQESSKQMTQLSTECSIFDENIEKAASQIEKNIVKSKTGLEKYVNQFVKRWGVGEALRIENQRLQVQNKQLFQLTTKLQQNFKETDKLIKQMGHNQSDQKLANRVQELQSENARLKCSMNALSGSRSPKKNQAVFCLQEKIAKLTQKLNTAEQQNLTIKSIHQRTMKKLQKLEQKAEQQPVEGAGIQQERQRWLEKTENMYEEIRRLNKALLLSEQSEKKIKEELSKSLYIYSQWEKEREQRKTQIEELKIGIETYIQKIEQNEGALAELNEQVEQLQEKLQVSQGEKQKIVSVYQLEVQELTDQLFKKQDAITQMVALINRQHHKHQQLKKQFTQLQQNQKQSEEKCRAADTKVKELIDSLQQKEQELEERQQLIEAKSVAKETTIQELRATIISMKEQLERVNTDKAELVEVMEDFKNDYYTVKKDLLKSVQQIESGKETERAITDELRSILGSIAREGTVWDFIAKVRQKCQLLSSQCTRLKQSQFNMTEQTRIREQKMSATIQNLKMNLTNLKQQVAFQEQNKEAELKIWKMRLLEHHLYQECNSSSINNITDLVDLLFHQKQNEQTLDKDAFSEEVSKLKETVVAKDNQINKLERLLKENAQQKATLQQTLLQNVDTQEELALKLESHENNQAKIRQQNNILKEKLEQLQQDLQKKQSDNTKLSQEFQAYRMIIENLQKEMQEKAFEQDTFSNQLQQELESMKKLQTEKESSKEEKIHEQIMQLKRDNVKLRQEKIAPLLKQVAQLKEQNEGYLKQVKNLLAEIETANEQNYQLNLQREQTNQTINLLNEMNETLKIKCEEMSVKINNKEKDREEFQKIADWCQKQRAQIVELKKELEEKDTGLESQKNIMSEQAINSGVQIINLNLQLQENAAKIQELQLQIKGYVSKLEDNQKMFENLKDQIQRLKQSEIKLLDQVNQLSLNDEIFTEKQELKKQVYQLKTQVTELKQQRQERNAKIEHIKKQMFEQQSHKQIFEDQLKDKQRQVEELMKENQHYKTEIKRVNKEKVLAESQASKYKFSLEEQQNLNKLRESQISAQSLKNSKVQDNIVQELKKEIQSLKEANIKLSKECEIQHNSKQNWIPKEEYQSDLPLQMESGIRIKEKQLVRQTVQYSLIQSRIIDLEQHQKTRKLLEEQVKHLKSELALQQKESARAKEAQRSNNCLSSELNLLRRELKTKSSNVQSLQKQFKLKTQDYSKLQRKVQSLSDELNLEKKRVKNFEELYQNIQSKRLRLANTKLEQ